MNFVRRLTAHSALKWGFLVGSFLLVGCASSPRAAHNDREGFFDRMAKWTPAHQSNPNNPLVHMVSLNSSGDKTPASRTSKKTYLDKISKAAGIQEADASSTIVTKPQAAGIKGIGSSSEPITAAGIQKIRGLSFRWPLDNVEVTSPFGQRKHEFHEGVDLRAKSGTSVYSAHAGQVLYAGDRISGYGRMIVIRHSSGIATVYAHNSKLLVRKGQWVSQGTRIAVSGSTGHSTGPHLHFEVRAGVAAINPLEVLPKTKTRVLASSR
jgi:murein DD-endopeptidase MepM/ murein hydrolase activator NlpD